MESLGATIKKYRLARGWTQEQLAEKVDMSQRWVSTVEADRVAMPRIKHLRALADALDVDTGELVLAAQYTDNVKLSSEIAETAPEPELPAYLRTSFHLLEEMTPERRRRVIEMIEEQALLDEIERERLRRDGE